MNCFQKLLSSWWRTTSYGSDKLNNPLWIAFKNYYLRDEGQRHFRQLWQKRSCELLSKIIIFVMKDNKFTQSRSIQKVVNCFQKLLSSWWRTTLMVRSLTRLLLWIAFKNYYLRDEGQLSRFDEADRLRCELLSKIIIFVMKDNQFEVLVKALKVVNCFQKLLSSWWRTTTEMRN